jgi:hypothetical protein
MDTDLKTYRLPSPHPSPIGWEREKWFTRWLQTMVQQNPKRWLLFPLPSDGSGLG